MIAICLAVFPVLGLFLVFGPDFSKAIIALRRTAEIVQSEDGAPNKSVETTLVRQM